MFGPFNIKIKPGANEILFEIDVEGIRKLNPASNLSQQQKDKR